MERFGEVDVCHMGNREDPTAEPPWVRFTRPDAAEKALAAIQTGEVFVDGNAIRAELKMSAKRDKGKGGSGKGGRSGNPERRDMDLGARELFLERQRAARGGGGGRSRSRSRDRRKKSRSRS